MSSAAALSPRACARLIADLIGEVGAKAAAVSWAHAVALVEHATAHGLVASLRQGSAGPDHTRRLLGESCAAVAHLPHGVIS
ncbi:hypothetical protein [Kitasatospora sp. NPDC051164]|uniref:hypothetical protein n=1 Tax=Kitasatospora sp. NPDC051164 TaxID=3364055 RepID=UPI0037933F76